jgi:methyl-accepting chemotaxis protein
MGFAAVVGFFLVTLVIVESLLFGLTEDVRKVDERSLPLVLAVDMMDLSRSDVQQFLTDVSATHDPAAYKDAEESAKRFHDGVATFRSVFQLDNDAENLKALESIAKDFDAFYAAGKIMAATYIDSGLEAGNLMMKGTDSAPGFDKASETLSSQLSKFREERISNAKETTAAALRSANSIQLTMIFGALGATLMAGLAGLIIVRSIFRQLGGEPQVAAKLARQVGEGDLSQDIRVVPGDTSSLMAQLKTMQMSLVKLVSTVRGEAEGLAHTSKEIAQGNGDLSSRTESQASSLEETAASMAELNVKVKQNVEGARQANQLAMNASGVAVKGGEIVSQFVGTMQGINESSRKIADIISVIDGIAFQTNILALNAAVEAARAGEQGRGFAVVASEVRSLAGRSAEAAKEIKSLINTSVERVEQGTSLVEQAGATMGEVVDSIRQVTDIMAKITIASSDQSAGVSQITEAITHMDEVTQQNAALVEVVAMAASKLESQSQELVDTVALFTLSGNDLMAAHRRAPAASSTRPLPLVARPKSPAIALEKKRVSAAPKVVPPSPKPTKPAAKAGAAQNDADWESF